jgi:predicted NAD/FAD-dependent oxidoreductase
VLHANRTWSAHHYALEVQDAIHRLLAGFFSATQTPAVEPVFATAHRWRYAQAENPMTEGALWLGDAMIGACGDWCAGSRVEGAYLSGAALAGKILAHIHQSA